MTGVEVRDHNGVHILRLHYTADPDKRSEEWKQQARQGLPERDWRREYEIDWTIASGLGVYSGEFVREWHVAKEPLLADINRPIYRGWDWGLTPACIWVQCDAMGRFNVIAEHCAWDGRKELTAEVQRGAERFAPEVIQLSNEWFHGIEFIDYADPAGWSKAQTDEKSCVDILRAFKIYPRKGPVTFTTRKAAMVNALTQAAGGRPKLLVSNDCTMIIEGLAGAYRYEQIGETGRYKETPEKNAWSHPADALAYVIGSLIVVQPNEDKPKPKRGKADRWTGY